MKKLLVMQSNYIPWRGYFDAFNLVDEVVILDNVQYTKNDWRNRNKIKTPDGVEWLTIPVEQKGKFGQNIDEVHTKDLNWAKKHWRSIEVNYAKSPYFNDFGPQIQSLYEGIDSNNLSQINLKFIHRICELFNVETKITMSTDFSLSQDKNQRLVELCKKTQSNVYYSGPAAKSYLDLDMFNDAEINIKFLDYSGYKSYPQQWGGVYC